MIGLVAGLLALGVALVIIVGLARTGYQEWRTGGDIFVAEVLVLGAAVVLIVTLFVVALVTGDIQLGPPDGCYQISSSSSVGIGANGQAGVLSGRVYTPISCP